jgi:quinol monooxygenase YgiN
MIVVLTEMSYAPESDDTMRSLVSDVEQFSRQFEGCEQFALSFPVNRPGTLLGAEVWRDQQALRTHVAVARNAAELEAWHELLTSMNASLFTASPLGLAAVTGTGDEKSMTDA